MQTSFKKYLAVGAALVVFPLNSFGADFGGLPNDPDPQKDFTAASFGVKDPTQQIGNLGVTQDAFFSLDVKLTDNVQYINWKPEITPRLRLRTGINTTIVLPTDEKIKTVIAGSDSFVTIQKENMIFSNMIIVRPKYAGIDGNLTVYTESGSIYNFYLFSEDYKSKFVPLFTLYVKKDTGIRNLQFDKQEKPTTVSDQPLTLDNNSASNGDSALYDELSSDMPDYLKSLPSAGKINTSYKMFGDEVIAPFGVYDDGNFTYFDYRETIVSDRLPVPYKVVDGYDSVINFRMEKGFMIIETLSPEGWSLINGEKTLCIRPIKSLHEVHKSKAS